MLNRHQIWYRNNIDHARRKRRDYWHTNRDALTLKKRAYYKVHGKALYYARKCGVKVHQARILLYGKAEAERITKSLKRPRVQL